MVDFGRKKTPNGAYNACVTRVLTPDRLIKEGCNLKFKPSIMIKSTFARQFRINDHFRNALEQSPHHQRGAITA